PNGGWHYVAVSRRRQRDDRPPHGAWHAAKSRRLDIAFKDIGKRRSSQEDHKKQACNAEQCDAAALQDAPKQNKIAAVGHEAQCPDEREQWCVARLVCKKPANGKGKRGGEVD